VTRKEELQEAAGGWEMVIWWCGYTDGQRGWCRCNSSQCYPVYYGWRLRWVGDSRGVGESLCPGLGSRSSWRRGLYLAANVQHGRVVTYLLGSARDEEGTEMAEAGYRDGGRAFDLCEPERWERSHARGRTESGSDKDKDKGPRDRDV